MSSPFESLSATDLAMQRATSFGYAFNVLSPYYPVFSQTMWVGSLKILPNLLPGLVHFMHFSKKLLHLLFLQYFKSPSLFYLHLLCRNLINYS